MSLVAPNGVMGQDTSDDWSSSTNWRPEGNTKGHGQSMKACRTPMGTIIDTGGYSTDSGFSNLLAGSQYKGTAIGYGVYGYLWSSSTYDANRAWYRNVGYNNSGVHRNNFFINYMYSVRCKK